MDDPFDRLNDQEIADTCALADGTLPEARRAEVEAFVRDSPELTALLQRQRRALAATAALAAEPVPDSLRHAVDGLRPRAVRRRRRLGWILSAAGVVAAALVVFAVLSTSGVLGGPTVAAAADFALGTPNGPGPRPAAGGTLDVSVGGVAFPDWSRSHGWRPVGARRGDVHGRPATVVFYEKDGRRIGYAIVDGLALPRPDNAATTTRAGVEYQSLPMYGRQVVTWQKGGHTCVLIGPLSSDELVDLASSAGAY
jgi:anti-sigma factor RsiW